MNETAELLLLQAIINKSFVNYKWPKVIIHWKAMPTQQMFTDFWNLV